jgi:tetratricopeptide (TPR) repeat protein
MAAVAVVAVLGFVVAVGNPVSWFSDRVDEFQVAGTPDLSESSSRFTFNAGSSRYDLWRVALGDLGDDPLFGDGGGGFQASYLQSRDTPFMNARDAHSVELEVAAELGLPGIALLLTALVAIVVGIARARRLGPAAAGLAAVALASGAYWLVHASLDWFWPYPAVTGPALLLLGAACAPAALGLGRGMGGRGRAGLIVALALLALSAIPPFLSHRYVDQASDVWRQDLDQAYGDLERARDLNPLSDWPYLIEGEIAREAGDRERAIDAFSKAIDKRPEQWAARYRLAELQADTQPLLARNQIRAALELNPLAPEIRRLAKELGLDPVAETGVRP